ncbi:hypothetical protein H6G58_19325 [Arthrospira platensis FACHB-971]|uniref:hypothetical protein n=2 Tax=Sirenicapillariaceae TaxID=2934961 RepID=UPI000426529F|nr:hypothetical protein APPUASWS_030220 [Arthrospira platensis str. Paraca]MBD2575100.1 hypothetical protein [Arthrospira platensis FACHB-971]MBD2671254.1 hypothetical protein [Arthrospira platensis FACHB-439]MBD2712203.1 hypothetical protein [Arthrospira platensis FACHB-835]MDT9312553.1 hypothetical protein [Limnospira sp. Paracas R14]
MTSHQIAPMLWVSIFLLMLTYMVFGWGLFNLKIEWHLWVIIKLIIILIALFLTVPLENLSRPLNRWFQSNLGAFLSVVFGAFLLVVLATHMEVFTTILMALSATILTRMELQTHSTKNWQAFLVLCLVSMLGLVVGWQLHHLASII